MEARMALIRSLGRLGNVIGVLGVIGSLVFVGLELRQSKTIAVAATLQERTNSTQAMFHELSAAGLDWQSFYNYFDLRPLYEARKSWMPDDFTALIAAIPDDC